MKKLKQILAIAMVVMMGMVFMPMVPGMNGVASADTEGWQPFGKNCRYKIETTGSVGSQEVTLTIAPAEGQSSGVLPYVGEITEAAHWPWHSERANITKVVIDDSIRAGDETKQYAGTTAYMFSDCSKLKSINLDGLDTSYAVNMSSMFYGCSALTKLDLAGFYTYDVTNMSNMFKDCTSLTTINASDNFNTSTVTTSTDMFAGCTNLKGGEGTEFDSTNTDRTYAHIDGGQENKGYFTQEFGTCTWSITNDGTYTILTIEPAKGTSGTLPGYKSSIWPWYGKDRETAKSITKVVIKDGVKVGNSTAYMFYGCEKLTSLDLSNFGTKNVTDMSSMFSRCNELTSLDVSNFDTENVTTMSSMFSRCNELTSLDVSNFDTKNVTRMGSMFDNCSKLTSLDLSNFGTKNVTDMSYMFNSCSDLTSLDLSNFDTENVTYMSNMFKSCSKLTSLDVSNFDTKNVTSMSAMFYKCSDLTSLDVSNFDTSKVTNMSTMFNSCSGLKSLDLSNFDISKVTNMSTMFKSCSKLTSLDVSNFDTKNVTSMKEMFKDCSELTTIYASDKFVTSKIENPETTKSSSANMFAGCTNLVGGAGTTYAEENPTDKTYAHIDGGTSNPGYFTGASDPVSYINAKGKTKTREVYTEVTASTDPVTWNAGWYVVNDDVEITKRITCSGAVHLILVDGKALTAKEGITCTGGDNSFTVYGQSGGTGTLTATTDNGSYAGIGGGYQQNGSNITINGGTVNATGGNEGGAGIGGGVHSSPIPQNGSNITINGGRITATGGTQGAGIGGGVLGNGTDITITGGSVTATGGSYGAGIGGGASGNGTNITITGGSVTATGGTQGAGIGNGYNSTTSASNIKAADDVIVKAGTNQNPTGEITHTSDKDIASDLAGKRYATAEKSEPQTIEAGTEEALTNALSNVKKGDTIKLTDNIDLTSTFSVDSGKEFTLDLNGKKLDGTNIATPTAAGQKASVIYVNSGATLTLDDSSTGTAGKITGGKGTSTTEKETTYGGGVYNAGTLNINAITITANKASMGAGVYNKGTLNMNSGLISYNESTSHGGGVYNNGGKFTMSNGQITSNTAAGVGSGVYNSTAENTAMYVSGTVKVTGNKKGSGDTATDNNVYLPSGKTINVGTGSAPNIKYLESGASIGVTTAATPAAGTPVAITGANSSDYSSYFTSDNKDYVVIDDPETGTAQIVKLAKAVAQIGDTKYTTVQKAVNAAAKNDTVKLLSDVDLTATIDIAAGKEFTLDMNGKKLDGSKIPDPTVENPKASVIFNAGTLTLDDSSTGTAGKITGGKGSNTGLYGGGVYNAGTLNIKKISITGNTAKAGAGVYNSKNKEINMYSGEISNNTATEAGGGVRNVENATLNMSGGSISGNSAVECGGGVENTGTTIVSGASKITGNTSGNSGSKITDNYYGPKGSTKILTIGTNSLASGAKIGVTLAGKTGAFTTNGSSTDVQYFTSDNQAYKVKYVAATEGASPVAAHLELVNYDLNAIASNTTSITLENDAMTSAQAIAIAKAQKPKSGLSKNTYILYAKADDFSTSNNYKTIFANSSADWDTTDDCTLDEVKGGSNTESFVIGTVASHTHNFAYSAADKTITATCDAEGCGLKDSKVTATLVAEDKAYTGEAYAGASITGKKAWDDAGAATLALKYKGKEGSDTSYTESATAPTAVGKYTVTMTASDKSVSADFEITKKQLSISEEEGKKTVVDASKTYDGTTAATVSANGELTGVIGTEKVSLDNVTATYVNKNVGTGKKITVKYTIKGQDAGNYKAPADNESLTANITKKEISVAGTSVAEKTYDGKKDATVTAGNLQNVVTGDKVTLGATGEFDNKDVGEDKDVTVKYTLSGDDAGNYELASEIETLSADISKKDLAVTDTAVKNKEYDGKKDAEFTAKGTIADVVAGDQVTLSATGEFKDKNVGTGKNVTVTYSISGTDAGNYNLTTTSATKTANITAKELTVSNTTVESSKVYDGNTDATVTADGTLSGAVETDAVEIKKATAVYEDKDAGNGKKVTVTYTLKGNDSGNYTVKDTELTASISKKDITLTSADATKEYDGTPLTKKEVTESEGNWITGEGAEYDVTGSQTEVGSSPNTFEYTLKEGTKEGNYNISTANGTLKVNPLSIPESDVKINKIDGTNATINKISQEDIDKAGETLTIDLSGIEIKGENKEITQATLTTDTLKNFDDSDAKNLKVIFSSGTVVLNETAVEAVYDQAEGDKVTLTIETGTKAENELTEAQKKTIGEMNAPSVVFASLESNSQTISDFKGGKAKVLVEYKTSRPINVWFVEKEGDKEGVTSSFDSAKQIATFEADHFSIYVIEAVKDVSVKTAFIAQGKAYKKSIKYSWTPVEGAATYKVYQVKCGKKYKKVKTTSATSFTKKKLQKGKAYKAYVVACDASGNQIAKTPAIHVMTKKGNRSNAIAVTAAANATIKAGTVANVGAKIAKKDSKKKLLWKKHVSAKVRYYSADPAVATVDAAGNVTGVAVGTANIYSVAPTGVNAVTKVTVEKAEPKVEMVTVTFENPAGRINATFTVDGQSVTSLSVPKGCTAESGGTLGSQNQTITFKNGNDVYKVVTVNSTSEGFGWENFPTGPIKGGEVFKTATNPA